MGYIHLSKQKCTLVIRLAYSLLKPGSPLKNTSRRAQWFYDFMAFSETSRQSWFWLRIVRQTDCWWWHKIISSSLKFALEAIISSISRYYYAQTVVALVIIAIRNKKHVYCVIYETTLKYSGYTPYYVSFMASFLFFDLRCGKEFRVE